MTENASALAQLLAPDVRLLDARRGAEVNALSFWQARMAQLDYGLLKDRVVFRPTEITVYRGGAAVEVGAKRASLSFEVPEGTVLVEVPIVSSRVGAVDLLGEKLWFVLKPDPNGYRIAGLVENSTSP